MSKLYDLIFLGVNADGADRAAVVDGVSALLGIDAGQIEYLLDNQLSGTVRQALPLEPVRAYQHDLERLGVVCNYRPARENGSKLELAPVEAKREESVFVCPACEHRENYPAEDDPPNACPECGVIPSKYEKLSGLKHARVAKPGPANPRGPREPPPDAAGPQQPPEPKPFIPYPQSSLSTVWQEPVSLKKPAPSRMPLLRAAALGWVLGAAMGAAAVSALHEGFLPRKAERRQAPPPPTAEPPSPPEDAAPPVYNSVPLPAATPESRP